MYLFKEETKTEKLSEQESTFLNMLHWRNIIEETCDSKTGTHLKLSKEKAKRYMIAQMAYVYFWEIYFGGSLHMSKGNPIKENKDRWILYWGKMKGIFKSPIHCEEETSSEGQQASFVTTN